MSSNEWTSLGALGGRGFGEGGDEETISALSFDASGEYIATGDRGGCVCIFKEDSAACKAVSCVSVLFSLVET